MSKGVGVRRSGFRVKGPSNYEVRVHLSIHICIDMSIGMYM